MKKQLKLILLLLPSVLMVSSNLCAKNEGKMLYKDAKAPKIGRASCRERV